MALKDIIRKVCDDLGLDAVDQRAQVVDLINDTIDDIYKKSDMYGCLFEQIMRYDNTLHQIALPSYVKYVRGMRDYATGFQLQVHDMRPRYASSGWAEQWQEYLLPYRDKQEVPIKRITDVEGPLTFTISEVESSDILFSIVGGNSNANRIIEAVTLPAGSLTVTSAKFYDLEKVARISKNISPLKSDVVITDINGVEVSGIFNDQDRAAFRMMQIPDYRLRTAGADPNNSYIELLYKVRTQRLINDEDEFVVPEVYDDTFYWGSKARYLSKKEGRESDVAMAVGKMNETLNDANRDATEGVKKMITFMPNPIFEIFRGLQNGNYSYNSKYQSAF